MKLYTAAGLQLLQVEKQQQQPAATATLIVHLVAIVTTVLLQFKCWHMHYTCTAVHRPHVCTVAGHPCDILSTTFDRAVACMPT
jgi:hypothetical protein